MKLLWVLLVAVTINESKAKSVIDFSEEEVKSNPSSSISPKRNSMYFPNMPDKKKKFIVNLNPIKTESQITKPEKYSKRLMKKLPIKYVNYNEKAKIPSELTTRRTLMQVRKFTVKPHDVYAESTREKYYFNGNRKMNTNNLGKSISERYYTNKNNKPIKEDSSEQRFLNFKNVDMSLNDNDSEEFEKEEKNNYIAAASQKLKTVLLFPKRNNTKYFKVNPKQKMSEPAQENKSVRIDNISSDVNNQNHEVITENKEKVILFTKSEPKEMKSAPEDIKTNREDFKAELKDIKSKLEDMAPETKDIKLKLEDMKPVTKDIKPETKDIKPVTKDIKPETKDIKSVPKDKFSSQEEADHNEFMFVKNIKQKDSSFLPVFNDDEITTDSDIDIII